MRGWINNIADRTPAAATAAGIEVRGIQVRLGRHLALDDVTGQFESGSLTAVVGPNGAGKSTLLNVIAGLQRPTAGRITCPARDTNRLAYLQQQTEFDRDFPLTVAELAALGLWRTIGSYCGLPPAEADRVAAAIETVGLQDNARRRIGELSVGQMRRAFFARLLLQDATVILLDEPFAAVDTRTVETLLRLIAAWHTEGRTVIAVVHDLPLARAHFPSALLLARRTVAWGDTESVLADANLAQAAAAA